LLVSLGIGLELAESSGVGPEAPEFEQAAMPASATPAAPAVNNCRLPICVAIAP